MIMLYTFLRANVTKILKLYTDELTNDSQLYYYGIHVILRYDSDMHRYNVQG